ncbi:hypothetical protein BN1708_013861 [Verticillium longisporum]|uniref:Cupin 2 conserved barrel domain-containing protein n=1 Tax=Verticillium longisporum TaxID=100787 RepID=A0A0G4LR80_VERLO|nr:hypothetical protein BN1708_013861 [Verticillium longisporum]
MAHTAKNVSPEAEVKSHRALTTHLITRGSLTITYPEDESPVKETHGVGERVDVAAGRQHEVWVSTQGCTMVIGE